VSPAELRKRETVRAFGVLPPARTSMTAERALELAGVDETEFALLGSTTFKEAASLEELVTLIATTRRRGLDGLSKQVYFERFGGQNGPPSLHVAIDGLRVIAAATGRFAGKLEPRFSGQWQMPLDGGKTLVVPEKCVVTVYAIVQGQKCAFEGVAWFQESYRPNRMWRERPRSMLAIAAERQALRTAFPSETSGIADGDTDEEGDQSPRRREMQGGWNDPADGPFWRRMFFGLVRGTELDDDAKRHEWLLDQVGVNSLKAHLERATNGDMKRLLEQAAYDVGRSVPAEAPTDEELTAGWEDLSRELTTPNPATPHDDLAEKRAQMDAEWFEDEAPAIRDVDEDETRLDWDDVDGFVAGFRNRVRMRNQVGPVERATVLQVFDVMRAAMRDNVKGTQSVVGELAGRQTRIKDLTAGEANELLETANREGAAAWKAWCEAIVARRVAVETQGS
jgi:phage recombination protein Bet